MKKFVLLSFVALFVSTAFSQQQKRTTYLTIWFDKKYNYEAEHYYYIMNAEVGNSTAPEVFDLVIYKSQRDLANKNVDFYHKHNDSVKTYFNYFTNPTAGLEYLGRTGWQLVSVANEVSSDHKFVYSLGNNVPLTTVSSRAMYYFKKELE